MNKFYLIALTAVLMTVGSIKAQTAPKFGHINSQEILTIMPDTKQAEIDLQTFQGQLEKRLQELQAGYQAEIEKFDALPEGTPESTVNDMRDGILGIQQRIQDFQISAERDIVNKQQEILQPIIAKVQTAIDEVGNENGFTYIFDTSVGSVIFAGGGEDITSLVKSKLGITG